MSTNLSSIVPPDDTGTSTFRRYRYQAHVAFPFVLECGLGGEVISVVLEHVEDLAVEYPTRWRLIQIKTRDLERGPWRLSDLTGQGGGLHSLLRSYRQCEDAATTHELHLEGALHRQDLIRLLTSEQGRQDDELAAAVGKSLLLSPVECKRFLARVRLIANLPARPSIADRNLRSLGVQASHLATGVLEEIYRKVIARLDDAMAADLGHIAWHTVILEPERMEEPGKSTFDAKRLTREMIAPLLVPVTGAVRPLLRRLTDADGPPPSVLEQKLLAGGATIEIVRHAQNLRAQATILAYEYAAATLTEEGDFLEDTHQRLLMLVDGLRATRATAAIPAPHIWTDLLQRLPLMHDTIDVRGIFRRDPYMLLGEVCDLADQCLTDWGVAHA